MGPRVRSEAAFPFHLRVLAHMLRAPPWARLPLTVRWLRADFRRELCPPPPPHMPLAFGPPPPRAPAPRSRSGTSADAESEPDQDTEACCALCARSFQVSRPTRSPGRCETRVQTSWDPAVYFRTGQPSDTLCPHD